VVCVVGGLCFNVVVCTVQGCKDGCEGRFSLGLWLV
jgi:hypothetical protein